MTKQTTIVVTGALRVKVVGDKRGSNYVVSVWKMHVNMQYMYLFEEAMNFQQITKSSYFFKLRKLNSFFVKTNTCTIFTICIQTERLKQTV